LIKDTAAAGGAEVEDLGIGESGTVEHKDSNPRGWLESQRYI
jgi:hypothetical protein